MALDLSILAKPSLKPDDGGATGRGALLGCISDLGGFAGEDEAGVCGGSTGEDLATAKSLTGMGVGVGEGTSSSSATAAREGLIAFFVD